MPKRRARGDGGITKRRDGLWQGTVSYRDEFDRRQVKTFYGRTKSAVLDKMRDWRPGAHSPSAAKTVGDMFRHLLGDGQTPGYLEQQGTLRANTVAEYRSIYERRIEPLIGNLQLSRLKVHHLDAVILAAQEAGLSGNTVRNLRNVLSKCLAEAARVELIPREARFPLMTVSGKSSFKPGYVSLKTLLAVLEKATPQESAILLLGGLCALREAEMAGLAWSDIDFEKRTLTIARQWRPQKGKPGSAFEPTKTEAGNRTIVMPEIVAEALKAMPRTSLCVFPSRREPSRPTHASQLWHMVQAAIARAGVERFRVHDLRHSANSILRQLGVAPETRRDILGHSTVLMTQDVYGDSVPEERAQAAKEVDLAVELAKRKQLSTAETG